MQNGRFPSKIALRLKNIASVKYSRIDQLYSPEGRKTEEKTHT